MSCWLSSLQSTTQKCFRRHKSFQFNKKNKGSLQHTQTHIHTQLYQAPFWTLHIVDTNFVAQDTNCLHEPTEQKKGCGKPPEGTKFQWLLNHSVVVCRALFYSPSLLRITCVIVSVAGYSCCLSFHVLCLLTCLLGALHFLCNAKQWFHYENVQWLFIPVEWSQFSRCFNKIFTQGITHFLWGTQRVFQCCCSFLDTLDRSLHTTFRYHTFLFLFVWYTLCPLDEHTKRACRENFTCRWLPEPQFQHVIERILFWPHLCLVLRMRKNLPSSI